VIRNLLLGAILVSGLTACDQVVHKYPPGYTEDGIKIDGDSWSYTGGDYRIALLYPTPGTIDLVVGCNLVSGPDSGLTFKVRFFEPLQQWPQPELAIRTGSLDMSAVPSVEPLADRAQMSIELSHREMAQALSSLQQGNDLTFVFDGQTIDVPGPPQSMREGFARKCRSDG